MNIEISRRERHFNQLSEIHKNRLNNNSKYYSVLNNKITELRKAVIVNHNLIKRFSVGNYYSSRFNCYIGIDKLVENYY